MKLRAESKILTSVVFPNSRDILIWAQQAPSSLEIDLSRLIPFLPRLLQPLFLFGCIILSFRKVEKSESHFIRRCSYSQILESTVFPIVLDTHIVCLVLLREISLKWSRSVPALQQPNRTFQLTHSLTP